MNGILYFPSANLTYTGGSSTSALNTTIISDKLSLVGNSYISAAASRHTPASPVEPSSSNRGGESSRLGPDLVPFQHGRVRATSQACTGSYQRPRMRANLGKGTK